MNRDEFLRAVAKQCEKPVLVYLLHSEGKRFFEASTVEAMRFTIEPWVVYRKEENPVEWEHNTNDSVNLMLTYINCAGGKPVEGHSYLNYRGTRQFDRLRGVITASRVFDGLLDVQEELRHAELGTIADKLRMQHPVHHLEEYDGRLSVGPYEFARYVLVDVKPTPH